MEITAETVKKLRDRTGMQMMKCKAALTEAGGDLEKAVEILRKQNKDAQNKVADREVAEGRIAIHIDPVKKVGSILELRCESAPVAKSELFIKLASELAQHVAATGTTEPMKLLQETLAGGAHTVNDHIGEVVGLTRENMKVARAARLTGILGSYVHHDGTVGVLLQVEGREGVDPAVLRDVAMHITARNPVAALREHIPQERIAQETEIARAQAAQQGKGKPANILDKIAEGKLKTWYEDNVLADQKFVKDETKTVADLLAGHGLKLVRFVRFKVGELSQGS